MSRYWFRLVIVYAATLAFGFLCIAAAFLPGTASELDLALLILPCAVAPIVFAVALARSPWLRRSLALRVTMVVGGTLLLWASFLLLYLVYGQGVLQVMLRYFGAPWVAR